MKQSLILLMLEQQFLQFGQINLPLSAVLLQLIPLLIDFQQLLLVEILLLQLIPQ